jgi:pyruvate formate-lyase activating enzyme-like uncharacterized protein
LKRSRNDAESIGKLFNTNLDELRFCLKDELASQKNILNCMTAIAENVTPVIIYPLYFAKIEFFLPAKWTHI